MLVYKISFVFFKHIPTFLKAMGNSCRTLKETLKILATSKLASKSATKAAVSSAICTLVGQVKFCPSTECTLHQHGAFVILPTSGVTDYLTKNSFYS